LSFLMLGVTLWLLERARSGDRLSLWLLPAVCLLWVNLDSWFLFGPLTIALYLAGELLQLLGAEHKEQALPPARLGIVLLACLGACLINPFHFRAFELPAPLQFGQAASAFASDNYFRILYLAPWEETYYSDTRVGLSAAGLAYFVLLLAGLVSFDLLAYH